MNSTKRNACAGWIVLAGLLLVAGGCQKLKARDELNKGVTAYKAAKYPIAIEHFKAAVETDPTLLNAKLYLATAYASQYVPGSDEESNLKLGEQAISEFQGILKEDPNNLASINGIANLYFQMKRMDDAKDFYKKLIALDPTNATAYYSVGVINWTQSYQPRMELRARLKNLKPEDPIKDPKERAALAERNMPKIDEGMAALQKAMDLKPDYDDAMAYMNLLYREKADLEETPQKREEDLKTADKLIADTLEIKKKKAQKTVSKPIGG
jgi:tetratricopeptide (TPR) repeat protein